MKADGLKNINQFKKLFCLILLAQSTLTQSCGVGYGRTINLYTDSRTSIQRLRK